MKVIISGKDFKKPSPNAVEWAKQFESHVGWKVQIEHSGLPGPDELNTPVLVIPEKAIFSPIKSIMYATNFYGGDLNVIRQIANLARIFGASIRCVHIDTTEEYNAYANVLADRFGRIAADLEVTFTNVCSDSVYEGLETFLKNNKIDLVVMLHHRHKLPDKSKHNLIKVMANESELPLLLFPEKVLHN